MLKHTLHSQLHNAKYARKLGIAKEKVKKLMKGSSNVLVFNRDKTFVIPSQKIFSFSKNLLLSLPKQKRQFI